MAPVMMAVCKGNTVGSRVEEGQRKTTRALVSRYSGRLRLSSETRRDSTAAESHGERLGRFRGLWKIRGQDR